MQVYLVQPPSPSGDNPALSNAGWGVAGALLSEEVQHPLHTLGVPCLRIQNLLQGSQGNSTPGGHSTLNKVQGKRTLGSLRGSPSELGWSRYQHRLNLVGLLYPGDGSMKTNHHIHPRFQISCFQPIMGTAAMLYFIGSPVLLWAWSTSRPASGVQHSCRPFTWLQQPNPLSVLPQGVQHSCRPFTWLQRPNP